MQKRVMGLWDSGNTASLPAQGSGAWTHAVAVIGGDTESSIWEENINPTVDINYIARITEGIITIEKIALRVPILSEYTVANLNISVCSVMKANKMGAPGNYVLAGHYSRVYGRHFNRLRELSAGDVIIIENKTDEYRYIVSDVFTVTEADNWVMKNEGDKKLITLITCDYRTDPIGRLIVKGELFEISSRA